MTLQNVTHAMHCSGASEHPQYPGGSEPAVDLIRASQTDACVLITGPGQGALSLAQQIHELSGWRHGPFVVVDCRRTGEDLERHLAAVLWPEEPGVRADQPIPRPSQDGTVFLQEVGHMPRELQERLAVALAERRRGTPGATRRVIAGSSEPLIEKVNRGGFDDLLFYRLNVLHFVLNDPSRLN